MPTYFLRIVLALSFATAAVCQAVQPPCGLPNNSIGQSVVAMRTGVGSPYSLTAILKTEKTLSDGNKISGFTTSRQAHDSQGRTLVDEPLICWIDKEGLPHRGGRITITDPNAKAYMQWTDEQMPAFVLGPPRAGAPSLDDQKIVLSGPIGPRKLSWKWPTPQQEYNSQQEASRASGVRFQLDDLGKRNIAGLQASGVRITRTLPPGSSGNSLPLTFVEERWNSDDYGIYLLDIQDDPQSGRSSYEVINFVPGEPDPSLFQPPADYKIEEHPAASQ